MYIEIKNISKAFNNKRILNNINLSVNQGELTALLGPSGSGKTTLLRIIAGLDRQDDGSVFLGGEDIAYRPLREREIGFVFQDYALFKHMNVFDNIAFGLRVKASNSELEGEAIEEKVFSLLKLVQLEDSHNQFPSQLSGGQQQRVALARALAVDPKILLLDEPFGALDQKVRKELRRWIRKLHDKIDITSILVTHDQEEAMEVADQVVIMSKGRIEQVGTPKDVYHLPKNSFVYDFLGNYNSFPGFIDQEGIAHIQELQRAPLKQSIKRISSHLKENFITKFFKHNSVNLKAPIQGEAIPNNLLEQNSSLVKIFARPHQMEITKELSSQEAIPVKLIYINEAAPLIKLELERKDETTIQVEISKEKFERLKLKKGDRLYVYPEEIKVFKE